MPSWFGSLFSVPKRPLALHCPIQIVDLSFGDLSQIRDFIGQVVLASVDFFQQLQMRLVTVLGQMVEERSAVTRHWCLKMKPLVT